MDEEDLKQNIGLPLAGEDGLDIELDDPMDRELEDELDKTHPIPSIDSHQTDNLQSDMPGKASESDEDKPDDNMESTHRVAF